MEEQLISYEVAKLAKEKGFDERTWAYYYNSKLCSSPLDNGPGYFNSESEVDFPLETLSAPTQSLLQKWLREVHDVHIIVHPYVDGTYDWQTFSDSLPLFDMGELYFNSYEEASESALEYMLLMV